MTATLKDFNAIADQLRAAVRPDIKISVTTTMFNPFDGTPVREHYAVTADIGGDNGHTLHDWFPITDTPDDVVAAALRMIRHLRPTPAPGDTIEVKGEEILVQFVEVTPQGNWRVLGRFIDGEDFEKLADVTVTPFDWEA
jgi:hypothetical protein